MADDNNGWQEVGCIGGGGGGATAWRMLAAEETRWTVSDGRATKALMTIKKATINK